MYQQIITDINAKIEQTKRKLDTYASLIENNNSSEALPDLLEYWFTYKRLLDQLISDKAMLKDATKH
jgi:hypothetical protein